MDEEDYNYNNHSNIEPFKKSGSVKMQLANLDKNIVELHSATNDNRKNAERLRNQINEVNVKAIDKFNELNRVITEDLRNLESEFNRIKQSDSCENKFIGQQISSLVKDKSKLIDAYGYAKAKLDVCRKEIGIESDDNDKTYG